MSLESKIHINLIGTGYEINCALVQKELEQSAIQIAKSFLESEEENQALISSPYFEALKSYRGPNLFEPGQIEFWKDRKRLKTYKFQEIVQSTVLFPILNIEEVKLSAGDERKKAIAFGYQEKGFLAKYSILSEKFLMDDLRFYVIEIPTVPVKMKVLYKVVYRGKELKSVKEDTVLTGAMLGVVLVSCFKIS